MSIDQARAVADAVLYEGYLLYPYRATSRKNQVRWQFGVLGPVRPDGAAAGEEPSMTTQCPLDGGDAGSWSLSLRLRFLHLQERAVERYDVPPGGFTPVEELVAGERTWLSWDEAVEHEIVLTLSAADLVDGVSREVRVEGHHEVETLESDERPIGRIVRTRWPLCGRVTARTTPDDGPTRLTVRVDNTTSQPVGRGEDPARRSFLGAHLVLQAHGARFGSVIDPPHPTEAVAQRCHQHRCWPVLAGDPVADREQAVGTSDVLLCSPIILYDYPEVAEQSAGALFDSTEIDEILTLRVMTMTEQEKAEARATDPRAREIIDRCDAMSPAQMQQLHGILRDPHSELVEPPTAGAADVRDLEPPTFGDPDVPWWDPAADEEVRPEADSVTIDGVAVSKGSLVRVHPSRRADAQDLFFVGQVARVAAVLSDVDGGVHVALVLVDDPAADLHDWYGRYWYFDPDELEPLSAPGEGPGPTTEHREESRS